MAPPHDGRGDDDGPSTSAPAPSAGAGGGGAGQQKKNKRPRLHEPEYVRHVKDKKLRGKLTHSEALLRESAKAAAKVGEWLLPPSGGLLEAEGPMERTWRFKQDDILAAVDVGAASKVLDLSLPQLGPYAVDFTRNGRFALLAGARGHLALMDWARARLVTELQVAETTRDAVFLHNETFFAAAQKKYAYIYDKRGIEVHCLRDATEPARLQFLPHHFLLASIGEHGVLRCVRLSAVCSSSFRLPFSLFLPPVVATPQ